MPGTVAGFYLAARGGIHMMSWDLLVSTQSVCTMMMSTRSDVIMSGMLLDNALTFRQNSVLEKTIEFVQRLELCHAMSPVCWLQFHMTSVHWGSRVWCPSLRGGVFPESQLAGSRELLKKVGVPLPENPNALTHHELPNIPINIEHISNSFLKRIIYWLIFTKCACHLSTLTRSTNDANNINNKTTC